MLICLCACLVLVLGVTISGCGEGPDTGSTQSTAASPDETTTAPDPIAVFSTGVVDTWAQAMQELVALLDDEPDPATVESQVKDLKEEYIQELLAYGQQRQEFSDDEKTEANSLIQMGLAALGGESWFGRYMSLYDHYASTDLEFTNLMASFDVLTQYADFELLQQQNPTEAARLGIQ